MLFALLTLACVPTPPDTGTPDTDTGSDVDTSYLAPLSLEFVDASFERSPARYGLATDGHALYALRSDSLALHVSEDLGRTWRIEGDVPGMMVDGGGQVFALGATGVVRVLDGGRLLEPLNFPPGVASGEVRSVQVDGEGVLWLAVGVSSLTLWRSADGGTSWSAAELPTETQRIFGCRVEGGPLVLVRDDVEVLRWSGAAFESIGAVSEVNDCFVSGQGTVFVEAGLVPEQLRLPSGGATWEQSALPGYVAYRQAGERVLRIQNNGVVESSVDDGLNFAPLTAARPDHSIHTHVVVGEDLVSLDVDSLGFQGVARLPSGAVSWSVASVAGLPLYPRVLDLAFAEDGRMAMLYLDNQRAALYVQDATGVWYRGLDFTQAEARALAMSPDGERVIIGGTEGMVQILGDGGNTPLWTGRMTTAAGFAEPDAVTSLAWVRTGGSPVILAATASEQDTSGNLWRGVEAPDHFDWDLRTPVSSDTSFALRMGGYHGLAAAYGGGNLTAVTQLRSWYSTNGWLASMLSGNVLTTQTGWWEGESAWGDAALSGSISPHDGSWAFLWSQARITVNRPGFPPQSVEASLPRDGVERARFDAQGRLWVVGSGLLVHTVDAP